MVWATLPGLIHHGPISNNRPCLKRRGGRVAPPLSVYPQSWQDAYHASEPAFLDFLAAGWPNTEHGQAVAQAFLDLWK